MEQKGKARQGAAGGEQKDTYEVDDLKSTPTPKRSQVKNTPPPQGANSPQSNAEILAELREMEHKLTAQATANDLAIDAILNPRPAIPTPADRAALITFDPCEFPSTDNGNGELFGYLYNGQVKYDHARSRWLIKDTHFWAPDDTERVKELAVAAVRTLHRRAVSIDDQNTKKKITNHAIKSENEPQIRRMLYLARSKPSIADSGKEWDADPNIIGTPLGVVDLRTGVLRDGVDADKITRVIEHYDPFATAERWKQFLKEIFPDNEAFQKYIQMAVGYSLTGYTSEKCFFFCYGPANSGKTTFLEAVLTAVSEYGYSAPFEIFQPPRHGRGEGASPFSVAMSGRRIIKSTEPEARQGKNAITLNEGMIKEITGKDRITRRDNYGSPFTIKVTYHLWFAANDRPDIPAEAAPMWERIKTIPFNQTFSGDAMDTSLDAKLEAEKAGILNWIIEGAAMWWKASEGGTRAALQDIPPEIKEATAAWRSDNDLFAAFLSDECINDPTGSVTNAQLYEAYRSWWRREGLRENDVRFLSATGIGRRLKADGYEKTMIKRSRGWYGLSLINLFDRPNEPEEQADPELELATADF
jgi:putative DNA primase/helicase